MPAAPRPSQHRPSPERARRRSPDRQSVLVEKEILRVEMETEKLRVEKEKLELEKRKLQLEIQLLERRLSRDSYTIEDDSIFLNVV